MVFNVLRTLLLSSLVISLVSNAAEKKGEKRGYEHLWLNIHDLPAFANPNCSSTRSNLDIDDIDDLVIPEEDVSAMNERYLQLQTAENPALNDVQELLNEASESDNHNPTVRWCLATYPELNTRELKRNMLRNGAHRNFLTTMELLSQEELTQGRTPRLNPLGRIRVLTRLIKNIANPARSEAALTCLNNLLDAQPILVRWDWNQIIATAQSECTRNPFTPELITKIRTILQDRGATITSDTTGASSSTTATGL